MLHSLRLLLFGGPLLLLFVGQLAVVPMPLILMLLAPASAGRLLLPFASWPQHYSLLLLAAGVVAAADVGITAVAVDADVAGLIGHPVPEIPPGWGSRGTGNQARDDTKQQQQQQHELLGVSFCVSQACGRSQRLCVILTASLPMCSCWASVR